MLRTPKVALASAGLALALSACGAKTDAAPVPASPSATLTPSPETSTPAPVVTPTSVATVQADEPTFTPTGTFNENDALAFGQYYIQVLNHVRVTGDPSLLKSWSLPGCETCNFVITATDDLRVNGARYANPKLTFDAAYLDYFDASAQEADVRVEVSGDLGQLIDKNGQYLDEPDPMDHASSTVRMRMVDGQWKFQESM